MPRRSKIAQLPAPIRKWLDEQLIASGFQGYEQLTLVANQKLKDSGYALTFGKTATYKYGSKLELRLKAIKDATDAARLVVEASPDDENHMAGALVSLVQTELFEVLVALREAEAEENPAERLKLLSRAGKAIAELTRASIAQKRYAIEVRTKTRAAADAATKIARKGGLSKAGIEEIRREILGIAA